MKRMPTPWKWYWRQEDGKANCGIYHEKREGQAYSVCRAPQYATEEEWKDTASHIVHCVNAHDAMVHALETIHGMTTGMGRDSEIRRACEAALVAKSDAQ